MNVKAVLKQPLNLQSQVEKLKSHGICIEDEHFAMRILEEVNYYRLTGCIHCYIDYRKHKIGHSTDTRVALVIKTI